MQYFSHSCSILFVVDIGFMMRKAAVLLKPTLKIAKNDNRFTISENFVKVSVSNEFTVGEESELTMRPNGQKGKVSIMEEILLAITVNSDLRHGLEFD